MDDFKIFYEKQTPILPGFVAELYSNFNWTKPLFWQWNQSIWKVSSWNAACLSHVLSRQLQTAFVTAITFVMIKARRVHRLIVRAIIRYGSSECTYRLYLFRLDFLCLNDDLFPYMHASWHMIMTTTFYSLLCKPVIIAARWERTDIARYVAAWRFMLHGSKDFFPVNFFSLKLELCSRAQWDHTCFFNCFIAHNFTCWEQCSSESKKFEKLNVEKCLIFFCAKLRDTYTRPNNECKICRNN